MSIDPKDYAQGGVVTLFLAAIAWLFHKRAANQVKTDNAKNDRQSTFEEGVYREVVVLRAECADLRERNMRLTSSLKGAQRVLELYRAFEGLPPPQAKQMLVEAQESAFAALDELPPMRKR